MSSSYIEAMNVIKQYSTGDECVKALDDVSFSIGKGELTVVVGYSGSGKSTLLNALGNIMKTDSGHIMVDGNDILKFSEKQKNNYRKKSVAMIFQAHNLLLDLTAYENVLFGKKISKSHQSAELALEAVGMAHRKNHYPSQLSGGEQQRVSIARAIVKGCDLILCDEPTGALDVENGIQILSILQRLVREEGKTVIIVTHNMVITHMANHVITMKDGKIIGEEFHDTPSSVDELEW